MQYLIYKIHSTRFILSLVLLAFSISGCKKLAEVDPPTTSVTGASVYGTDATASAVLTNLYSQLSANQFNGVNISTTSLWAGLSADEFTLSSVATTPQIVYYKNALPPSSSGTNGSELWSTIYPYIFTCNAAIEGVTVSGGLTPAIKQQLLGEAKFMRAFFYFYLVNMYGDVPLAVSTDYTINATLPRAPVAQVYKQIISDLKDAQGLLSTNYLDATLLTKTTERVRPTQSAANALLARVYLFTGDYVNAEAQAATLINNTTYGLTTLNNVFLRNSNEAIWQLQSVQGGTYSNTTEAALFVLPSAPAGINSTHFVYLSPSLLNSFETGDQRKVNGNWVNVYTDVTGTYYYPFKYKVTSTTTVTATECRMIFRLAEQYLIRAESRAQQGNISGAQSDLNVIRTRAGLPNTTATDKASLLTAILHERQVELFTEMGQRWMDLKRTGNVDAVMNVQTALKGGVWLSTQQLYPLPLGDLLRDVNLTQNPGY